jgi:5S rRNA maturation endonuclease (ribonuclease M5)
MSDGMFHCFACNQVHTLQEVISFCFGHEDDYVGAWGWKWLVKNFATVRVEERNDIQLDFSRGGTNSILHADKNNEYVGQEELDSYRYIHPYMYKRKLTDDIIELFDVGYDEKTHCITFPVRDINGNCLFIARRSVRTKYFNYPAGVNKPLYGIYELYKELDDCNIDKTNMELYYDSIIVCESMLDALTCWVYGKYAVALNGLGNDLQFSQLKQLPTRKLILATDNDEAGMRARDRIRKHIHNKIITEYVLPEGRKDINELTEEEFTGLKEIF